MTRILHYIDQNLDNKLTLRNIAAVTCTSETYFSALFKKYNGIPRGVYNHQAGGKSGRYAENNEDGIAR